jgi:hypothetical protein
MAVCSFPAQSLEANSESSASEGAHDGDSRNRSPQNSAKPFAGLFRINQRNA